MVQYLYDQNIIIYTFAGLCGLGLLIRFIIDLVYNRMVKESDNLGDTNNKQLKHMKMKFETCYKLKIGVNNVDTFVDKSVLRHRFGGILLATWECFSGQVLYLSLLLVPISALFGVIYECGQEQILLVGTVGIMMSAILIFVDKGLNLQIKKKIIRMNLLDYLENFCKVRLEQEIYYPEQLEKYRQEYFKQTEDNNQGKAAVNAKDNPKDELDRRREARRKKEEEKRMLALKREEEQKRIEEIRREEEKRRIEERKRIAAKRREEELLRLQEEREALEARRNEAKKKAEEKQQHVNLKNRQPQEKEKILQSVEEDLLHKEAKNDMEILLKGMEEIAIEKERTQKERPVKETQVKEKGKRTSEQEERLIEDILKEFFA